VLGLLLAAAAGCASERTTASAGLARAEAARSQSEQRRILEETIARHSGSRSAEIQDTVTRARMKLGYLKARGSRWQEARREFEAAAAGHRGSSQAGGGFASLDRQAAYQAVVCLEAQAKETGDPMMMATAVARYESMLREDPGSPLVMALARRLARLAPDRRNEWDALLQRAVSYQERQARLAAAACGPKAVDHLIRALGGSSPGSGKLAEIGGQGADGTSVAGIRRMLEACGLASKGMYLNRNDFSQLKGKHLWLRDGHFVVIETARLRDVVVYDPLDGSTRPIPLPPLDDPHFVATVVVTDQIPVRSTPRKP
jgi:hypothetical protein